MAYVAIQKNEMDSFLTTRGFRPMELDGAKELVYGKRVDRNGRPLSLRIYTSIHEDTNVARKKGQDAIRLELFAKNGDKIVHIGHSRRVNRIHTWRKNLGQRIKKWESMVGPNCPQCDALMVLRKGKYGKFWGCSNYRHTGCKCTKKIN